MGTLPETMTDPETGSTLRRGVRPLRVSYKGLSVVVEVPGYYPEGEGDGVHVGADTEAVGQALRALKEQADGIPSPDRIRTIRRKLRLTQREAGALLRVGDKAFDKYERGKAVPSGPTVALLHLLERHPDLVSELRQMPGAGEAA